MSQSQSTSLHRDFLSGTPWHGCKLAQLPQDASTRTYYRLQGGPQPALLMDAPPPVESLGDFVRIAEHLIGLGLSAPHILVQDIAQGLAIVEDLGTHSFTNLLQRDEAPWPLYKMAIDCLLALHAHPRATDIALPERAATLLAEVELFCDWYLPQIGRPPCPDSARREFVQIWGELFANCPQLAQDTLLMCDFHVDNLLLLPERQGVQRCGLLDFQNACLGTPIYDLISLLEDARRDVPAQVIADGMAHYRNRRGLSDTPAFEHTCTLYAAQRHTRVIGTFARLAQRDGKTAYLQHLPRLLKLLASHLQKPVLAPLRAWFTRHCPIHELE